MRHNHKLLIYLIGNDIRVMFIAFPICLGYVFPYQGDVICKIRRMIVAIMKFVTD